MKRDVYPGYPVIKGLNLVFEGWYWQLQDLWHDLQSYANGAKYMDGDSVLSYFIHFYVRNVVDFTA